MSTRRPAGAPSRPGPRRAPATKIGHEDAAPWRARLDDHDEPLYTVAVVCELLSTDSQTLRRLGDAIAHVSARPSGNQRRYSRRDIDLLGSALDLVGDGVPSSAVARILELQHQLGLG